MVKQSYYDEMYGYWREEERKSAAARRALTRRRIIMRGSTILALGGVAAVLEACGGDSKGSGSGSGGSGVPTGSTPDSAANATAAAAGQSTLASVYPLVDKYNWRKLDWNAGPPTQGGTLLRGARPPANWDLMPVATLTASPAFYNGLYRPRLEPGANLDGQEFGPDLAANTEPNADYTSWTFKIPAGVKFHDKAPVNGRECTAEDVAYSFQKYKEKSVWSVPLSVVDKISAIDKTTVRFDMKQPYFALPNILGMPYYLIFAREHFEGPEDRWKQQAIGTGPFTMEFSDPADRFEAARHPGYWEKDRNGRQLPYLDKFTSRYFADRNALLAAFRSGNLDTTGFTDTDEFETMVKSVPSAYYVVTPHWATYQNQVLLQWNNPLFKDVRIRQALSMAINRKELVDRLLRGAGTPAYPVPFDQMGLNRPLGWDDMPESMKFNPQKAKALLAEAGKPNGFKMQFLTPTPVGQVYVLVKDYWKAIGVEMNFEEKDFLVVQSQLVKKDFPDSAFYSGVAGFDPDVVVRPLYYPDSPQNWGNVNDAEMTGLMDKLRVSVDAGQRKTLAKQINDRALDQSVQIFVNGYHNFYGTHPWLHTIAQSLYTTIENWGNANWRFVWIDERAPAGRGGKKV
ncbi:MAG: ABC transporter substrate-binding protein [Chloroflexi bacterium]|nr:ABC transporter substrate-binding protein [Chloroflexota bacterium]